MAVRFTATAIDAGNSLRRALALPANNTGFRVTVPFKKSSNPANFQCLFFAGNNSTGTDYMQVMVASDGTMRAALRTNSSDIDADTANAIDTSNVNLVTVIVDNGGGGGNARIRIKLNGGSAVGTNESATPRMNQWNQFSFGAFEGTFNYFHFTGDVEQPCAWDDNDDFADHDTIYNSGTVLNPSSLSLGEVHRWPFSDTSGSVTGTDTAIDDSPGSADLDTLRGTPTYVANFLTSGPSVTAVAVDNNGYDVRVTLDQDISAGSSGFTVNVGGSAKTHTFVRTGDREIRLRLANTAGPILTGDTVTLDYTPGDVASSYGPLSSFSGTAVTNNSKTTATKIFLGTVYGQDHLLEFGSSFTSTQRGIYADGSWWITVDPSSRSPASSGSGATYRNGQMVNPACGAGETDAWDGRSSTFGAAEAFPGSLATNDSLCLAMSINAITTWATATAYSVGDTIQKSVSGSNRFFVCTTAGTSHATTEPTWTNSANERETITDGTVTWTNHGRTPIHQIAIVTKVASGPAQTAFRPPPYSGSDKSTSYSTASLTTADLPGWSVPASVSTIAVCKALIENPWIEITTDSGGEGAHPYSMRQYGLWCAQDTEKVIGLLLTSKAGVGELQVLAVQRGIDYKGLRDAGGYWYGSGGHGHGRAAYPVLAGVMLNQKSAFAASIGQGFGEFNTTFYVAQSPDITSGRYTYAGGDSFPSTVNETWLYVPEWGRNHGQDPTIDDKDWAESYRGCCTAIAWWTTALLIKSTGFDAYLDVRHFTDYMLRVEEVEIDVHGSTFLGSTLAENLWESNRDDAYGAFDISTATASGLTLTVTFNRYAVFSTDGFALSGGVNLSSPTQTGPRTWQWTTSAAAGGKTLTYTAASGDCTDAGGAELADGADIEVTSLGSAAPSVGRAFVSRRRVRARL